MEIKDRKSLDLLLNLKADDVDADIIKSLLANTVDGDAPFDATDSFVLPKGRYYNKENVTTTVGRYIFNLVTLTERTGPHVGYINFPVNGSGMGKIEAKMSDLLMNDIISVEDYSNWIDRLQWLGFSISDYVSPPLTTDLLVLPEKVKKRKQELLSKESNVEALNNKDIITASKIEKELLDMSKEELKDLPDMDIYDSGSRGSFGNNYKITAVSRGVVPCVSHPERVNISMASLDEGIPPEERYIYADVLTNASASRSLMTRNGGYEAKKLAAAFQGIVFDKKGSDCGTRLTVPLLVTEGNKKLLTDRYIMVNNRTTLLTSNNIDEYVGKTVSLRSPMYCRNPKYCSKCTGELYHKLGIENVGLIANVIGTSMTTLSMKAFHNATVKLKEINYEDYID